MILTGIISFVVGAFFGITIMALCNISRDDRRD